MRYLNNSAFTTSPRYSLVSQRTRPSRWLLLCVAVLSVLPACASVQVGAHKEPKTPVVIVRGDVDLHGWFIHADAEGPAPVAILLHGFPGNPEDPLGLGRELAALGVHALAFNFAGTHESGGEFSMRTSQSDIAAALAFLRDPVNIRRFEVDPERIALGGWSFGGLMALTFASNNDDPNRVFGLAPSDGGKIARDMRANPELEAAYRQVFDELAAAGTIRTADGLDELLRDPTPWDLRMAAPRLANHSIFIASGVDDLDTPLEAEILPVYRELKTAGNESVVLRTYRTDHPFTGAVAQVAADIAA